MKKLKIIFLSLAILLAQMFGVKGVELDKNHKVVGQILAATFGTAGVGIIAIIIGDYIQDVFSKKGKLSQDGMEAFVKDALKSGDINDARTNEILSKMRKIDVGSELQRISGNQTMLKESVTNENRVRYAEGLLKSYEDLFSRAELGVTVNERIQIIDSLYNIMKDPVSEKLYGEFTKDQLDDIHSYLNKEEIGLKFKINKSRTTAVETALEEAQKAMEQQKEIHPTESPSSSHDNPVEREVYHQEIEPEYEFGHVL